MVDYNPKKQPPAKISQAREYFQGKADDAYYEYQKKVRQIESDVAVFSGYIEKLHKEGLILIDNFAVNNLKNMYDIDMYSVLAEHCRQWRRPFIRCMDMGNKYIVHTNGSGVERQLVASLLFVAEPLGLQKAWNKKTREWRFVEPDLIANKHVPMSASDADIRSWTTARTITILFTGVKGRETFKDWFEFSRTDRMQRMYLGV